MLITFIQVSLAWDSGKTIDVSVYSKEKITIGIELFLKDEYSETKIIRGCQ